MLKSSPGEDKKALIIFIKNPEAGKVKTRLAKDAGNENALTVYKYLLSHTRQVSSVLPVKRFLFYDKQINLTDEWPEELYEKKLQRGDDLGSRMFNAFYEVFRGAYKQVIIIGSDCPGLKPELIRSAFNMLDSHDFVLGPAKDGGYYLFGMNCMEQDVFMNKAWSTASVAADTLFDIKRMGKRCFLLPVLSDIDTIDDISAELKEHLGILY